MQPDASTPPDSMSLGGLSPESEPVDSRSLRSEELAMGWPSGAGGVDSGGGGRMAVGTARRCRPRPPKLYRIGEVVEYSGMSRQTIHNYTTMGLLEEMSWTRGGHRLYPESVFERLDHIAELKAQRKSLQDIREFFAGRDST